MIDYDVRYAQSEDLLSTTVRETAMAENAYIEGVAYEPITIYTPVTAQQNTLQQELPLAAKQAVIDMQVGEEVSLTLTPEEAYGDNYDERLVFRYPLSLFEGESLKA